MTARPSLRAALLLAILAGCDEASTASTPPSPSASASAIRSPSAPPWRRALTSPAAFDAVGLGDGALLVWAEGEALKAASVDAAGEVAKATTLATSEQPIVEVALGTSPAGTAAVWSEGDATSAALKTVVFDPGQVPSGPLDPVALGPTTIEHASHRGRLAVTRTSNGGLVAYARGETEPCSPGESALCATFASHDLPPDGSRSRRPPLVLPHPCTKPLVGFSFVDGRFDYAVCNREGSKPEITLFTAQPSPQYAQAETLLTGCAPVGTTVLGDDLWVTAQCGSVRTAQRLRGIDLDPRRHALDEAATSCADGHPVIDLGGGGKHRLEEPTDHLAAVLPVEVASGNATALWTGEALLVAQETAHHLELRVHRCVDGAFVRSR